MLTPQHTSHHLDHCHKVGIAFRKTKHCANIFYSTQQLSGTTSLATDIASLGDNVFESQ